MTLTKEQAVDVLANLKDWAELQPDVAVTHDLPDGVQLRVTYSPPRDRRGYIDLSRVTVPSLLWHTDIAIGGAVVVPWDFFVTDEHALYLLEGGSYEGLCERRQAEGEAAVAQLTRRMGVLDA